MQTCCRVRHPAFILICLPFVLLAIGAPDVSGSALPREVGSGAETQVDPASISNLVEQLGAEQYAKREKAQAQLRQFGLEAFDALYAAQDSDDIEISMRARYLLQSLTIRWADEDDPPSVRELLGGYEGKADDERYKLMEQLIGLSDNQGLSALCRLLRFDTSNELSKRAALLIMRRSEVDGAAEATRVADSIVEAIGTSQRGGAQWLLTYVQTLEDPEATLETWQRIVDQEQRTLQYTPDKSSLRIVRDLLHWQAEVLERCDREDEALAVILRTVDLVDGTREELLETVDWLIARDAWAIVQEVAKRLPARFDESPRLLYRLAESQRESGHTEQSERTAARALRADPESPELHTERALWVQELGLFDWSEREYRHVIQTTPPETKENLEARFLFSEMLHDLQRDQEAAEILQEAVTVLERDENARRLARRSAEGVKSRMHYFFSEHFREKGDFQQQLDHLQQGVQADPDDGDVLIALYRESERSPERRKKTLTLIEKSAQTFHERVGQYEQLAVEAPTEKYRADVKRAIAMLNNQFAWLIANTEGDYQNALRCSQRSLELRPNTAGYLDTLGRCYYATGDLEKAIEVQARAVKLEPHTHQIHRQLEMFQQARQATQ